jgi:hypothetical protein
MAKEPTESRRKLVEFDAQTWHALDLFQGLPMRHSEISCTRMHGDRFEGGAYDRNAARLSQQRGGSRRRIADKDIGMQCDQLLGEPLRLIGTRRREAKVDASGCCSCLRFGCSGDRQWEQKGLAMWTTVLAYVLDFVGFITFAAGGLAFMWLIFEEVAAESERVPLRHYAVVATMISGGLSMIGIAQGLRLLLLLIAKP